MVKTLRKLVPSRRVDGKRVSNLYPRTVIVTVFGGLLSHLLHLLLLLRAVLLAFSSVSIYLIIYLRSTCRTPRRVYLGGPSLPRASRTHLLPALSWLGLIQAHRQTPEVGNPSFYTADFW
jgi:hypothetical protein